MLLNRFSKGSQVITPFQHGNHSSPAEGVGKAPNDTGHRLEPLFADAHARQRIVPMRIKARGNEDEIRAEPLGGRNQEPFKSVEIVPVAFSGRKGDVEGCPLTFACALFFVRTGPGVKRELMSAEIEDGGVSIKDGLGPVSMMDVPIDNEDPGASVF